MARILVFDVNETLLDLQPLAAHFQRVFGDATVIDEWFTQLILYAEGLTLADSYRTFGEVGIAALQMIAETRGVTLSEQDAATSPEESALCRPTPRWPRASTG